MAVNNDREGAEECVLMCVCVPSGNIGGQTDADDEALGPIQTTPLIKGCTCTHTLHSYLFILQRT